MRTQATLGVLAFLGSMLVAARADAQEIRITGPLRAPPGPVGRRLFGTRVDGLALAGREGWSFGMGYAIRVRPDPRFALETIGAFHYGAERGAYVPVGLRMLVFDFGFMRRQRDLYFVAGLQRGFGIGVTRDTIGSELGIGVEDLLWPSITSGLLVETTALVQAPLEGRATGIEALLIVRIGYATEIGPRRYHN